MAVFDNIMFTEMWAGDYKTCPVIVHLLCIIMVATSDIHSVSTTIVGLVVNIHVRSYMFVIFVSTGVLLCQSTGELRPGFCDFRAMVLRLWRSRFREGSQRCLQWHEWLLF